MTNKVINKKTLNLKATNVFERNYNALKQGKRYLVNQGGSGSSKTWSIAQLIVAICFEETGNTISIIRKSLPDLKKSVMRDFYNILRRNNLYLEANHNKTNNIYTLNGNDIEFFGLERGQKVRGARRQYLWLNEANEIDLDSFRQLAMRTEKAIFLDYNPSDQYHWIYDEVLSDIKTIKIRSTYEDNPFLPEEERKEIEGYKNKDKNYWRIYGQGLVGTSQNTVYNHWQHCNELPEGGERMFGLDFGWTNPATLVEVVIKDNTIYVKECFYESHLTDDDLIEKISEHCNKEQYIYADTEDPKAIKKIKNAGFNVKGATKGKGSVISGIKEIQKRGFYIVKGSTNILKEVKAYSFKTKGDMVLDEPVKVNDHTMDAIRMAIYSYINKGYIGFI